MLQSFLESPFPGLLAFKLNEINLNDPIVFKAVNQILFSNKAIVDVNLQGSGLQAHQLAELMETLTSESKDLRYLNISFNALQIKP